MNEQDLQEIDDELRGVYHSEWRWTHDTCTRLLAEVRYLREHLDNAERDRDGALARVEKLEAALRKVIKHQPWPSTDQTEADFAQAGLLLSEPF